MQIGDFNFGIYRWRNSLLFIKNKTDAFFDFYKKAKRKLILQGNVKTEICNSYLDYC
jgi:hypothetical protein